MTAAPDKVVIVTGGGTGIGAAVSKHFADRGWQVLISGRREDVLTAHAAAFGGRISVLAADLTEPDQRKRIVATAIERYGRLDALINNAACAPMGGFMESQDADFERAYTTNVVAAAALIRDAVPHLSASQGAVVNISTVAARAVLPALSAYLTSKAALNHLTRVLAVELGPLGVRVNAVAPGALRTALSEPILESFGEEAMAAMTPLRRLGTPADMANTVYFLASPEAGWVTGQIVEASGGIML